MIALSLAVESGDWPPALEVMVAEGGMGGLLAEGVGAVSYTHLTLPTKA